MVWHLPQSFLFFKKSNPELLFQSDRNNQRVPTKNQTAQIQKENSLAGPFLLLFWGFFSFFFLNKTNESPDQKTAKSFINESMYFIVSELLDQKENPVESPKYKTDTHRITRTSTQTQANTQTPVCVCACVCDCASLSLSLFLCLSNCIWAKCLNQSKLIRQTKCILGEN